MARPRPSFWTTQKHTAVEGKHVHPAGRDEPAIAVDLHLILA
ncbi:hypothetical protein [Arthrobacter humicola]